MTAVAGDTGPSLGQREPLNPAVRSISAVLPCFNDAGTIATVVTALRTALLQCGVGFEIVVVDDGSSDNSPAVLADLEATMPELRVIRHPANQGYGAALRSGFGAAGLDWVFYTDGDGQYDPAEMVEVVRLASDDIDWVQGWKIARRDPWPRRVVGRLYHQLVRLLFDVKVRDTDCDFRLIRRSLLREANLRSASGAICAEMVFKCRRAGGRMVETPVHHYARHHGRSQFFRVPRIARTLYDVALLWLRLVVLRRPDA